MTAARVTRGAISLSSSSHFPLVEIFKVSKARDVSTWPRQAIDEAGTDRIDDRSEYNRHCAGCLEQRPYRRAADPKITSGARRDQFGCVSAQIVGIACGPADVDPHVAAVGPAQLLQSLQERCNTGLALRVVRCLAHKYANAPHPLGLLRPRRERPRRRRAAEKRDELAPPHSITSSARASNVGWNFEAERLCGLEVYDQFELG